MSNDFMKRIAPAMVILIIQLSYIKEQTNKMFDNMRKSL